MGRVTGQEVEVEMDMDTMWITEDDLSTTINGSREETKVHIRRRESSRQGSVKINQLTAEMIPRSVERPRISGKSWG